MILLNNNTKYFLYSTAVDNRKQLVTLLSAIQTWQFKIVKLELHLYMCEPTLTWTLSLAFAYNI